jgi:hypothetical protein
LATSIAQEREHIEALSQLTLAPDRAGAAALHMARLTREQRAQLLELADSHHVVVRSLRTLRTLAIDNTDLQRWIEDALAAEDARIQNALKHLDEICRELENADCRTTVMKSLDHWPDLGNDLDLYTTADDNAVVRVFTHALGARVEPRSWGDRLAHKWNFAVAGLRESVEVHVQRLGQTGEHIAMAQRFVTRRVPRQMEGYTFYVPAPEERVIVATLQRMYRHFYFRVCDIVNTAVLVDSGTIDYDELRRSADMGGIWPGVATYLEIVSDYVKEYRGRGLDLPPMVTRSARFGGEKLQVFRRFLRIPLMPEGARLYTNQWASTALRGNVPATFRLSLLPPLASVAAVAFKITGDDKGIW